MRWPWVVRRRRDDDPEVQAATEVRDELLIEADAAIRKVDRLQSAIIEDYAAADAQRLKNGERRRWKRT